MKWTCDKCGKTLDVSQEQLYETQGVVVCPQCLSSDTVPGYRRWKPQAINQRESDAPSKPSATTPPPRVATSATKSSPTPPPYRKKINFVEESSSSRTPSRAATGADAKRTAPSKKKRKKKKNSGLLSPGSSWGCLWRTLLYTAILLVVVTFVGYILDTV